MAKMCDWPTTNLSLISNSLCWKIVVLSQFECLCQRAKKIPIFEHSNLNLNWNFSINGKNSWKITNFRSELWQFESSSTSRVLGHSKNLLFVRLIKFAFDSFSFNEILEEWYSKVQTFTLMANGPENILLKSEKSIALKPGRKLSQMTFVTLKECRLLESNELIASTLEICEITYAMHVYFVCLFSNSIRCISWFWFFRCCFCCCRICVVCNQIPK